MKNLLAIAFTALIISSCGYRGALHASYIPEVTDSTAYEGVKPEFQQLAALMEKDTGLAPSTGNTITFIPEGDRKLKLMLHDMQNASKSLYLEYFRICVDSTGLIVKDLLHQKAANGLDVRVIVDGPAVVLKYKKKLRTLKESGAQYFEFHKPVMLIDHLIPPAGTHRDHRKILLMDGRTVYLGGRNIQDKYFVSWRDADVRITGPVIKDIANVYMENLLRVHQTPKDLDIDTDLRAAAVADTLHGERQYYDKTVQIVHDSPTDKILPIRNCFEWAINNSKKYFWVYSPYTPPPRSTIKAMKDAAQRGVDVRWIVQGVSDVFMEKYIAEALYRELLEAGVRIYEWQETIMHAKQFMSDDYLMAIGSANMDNLSFFLNYEVETLIYDEEMTKEAAKLFLEETTDRCVEVSLEEVRKWNIFRQFRNWFFYTLGGPVG